MTDFPSMLETAETVSADEEERALREWLEQDGVRLCAHCAVRPAKEKSPNGGPVPKFCQECADLGYEGRRSQTRTRRRGGPQGAPGSVNIGIDLGAGGKGRSKADKEMALVEARAKQFAQFIAVGVSMVGQADDAADLAQGAEMWAKAMGGLAPYEPWLVKICQGGDQAGRAIAWLTVILATLGLTFPVLMRHGVIPDGPLKDAFAGMSAMAAAGGG